LSEPVHDDLIHELLWARSDRLNRLHIIQKDFADEVGISKFTMNHCFKRLEAAGRIKKIQSHQGNMWTYLIRDPDLFPLDSP